MTRPILASASTSRARLLAQAGVDVEIRPAPVDESAVKAALLAEGRDHRAVADALAELKAVRVSSARPGRLVIGADQVLSFEGSIVSKAESIPDARSQLQRLRGKRHALLTAAVLARDGAAIWRHVETAQLSMREFSDAFLDAYLQSEGKALLEGVGCYRLEGPGAQLFARISGDYFSILGLPLLPLMAALREQGAIAR